MSATRGPDKILRKLDDPEVDRHLQKMACREHMDDFVVRAIRSGRWTRIPYVGNTDVQGVWFWHGR